MKTTINNKLKQPISFGSNGMILGDQIKNSNRLIIKIVGDNSETMIDLTKYRNQSEFNVHLQKTLQKLFESKIYRNYHVDVTTSSSTQKSIVMTFIPIPGAA